MATDQLVRIEPATILGGRVAEFVSSLGLPWGQTVEAILALVVTTLVLYGIGRLAFVRGGQQFLDAREVDRHLQLMVLRGIHIVVIAGAIGLGLFSSGYTFVLGMLVAGMAAGGLSIGFALQGAVKNVVAGLFIYAERPFRIGEEIEWDGNAGTVQDIKLRVTRVRTYDNKLLTVPNSKLTEGVTLNYVKEGPLRLETLIPIDLKADVEEAKQIILEEADRHDKILEDPAPEVIIAEFEESRVLLEARTWVANYHIGDRVGIRDEFATAVKARLDEEGIEIPYPSWRLSPDPALVEGQAGQPQTDPEDPSSEREPAG